MRIFLAVDLHATLGPAAHDWGRAVAAALGPRDAGALSWVPAQRIHVTLHFFGALDRDAVTSLSEALGEAVPADAFDVMLGDGGTFPAAGRPRVIWLGLRDGTGALARLHAWIAPRVAGIGPPDHHAAFSPHVTIARVRRDAGRGLGAALRAAVARTPAPLAGTRVEAITLFESVTSGKGPTYLPVARLPLVGRTASG